MIILASASQFVACQAEDYGRKALYEVEDLPYRRDAEKFMAEYTAERKKQHARLMADEDH